MTKYKVIRGYHPEEDDDLEEEIEGFSPTTRDRFYGETDEEYAERMVDLDDQVDFLND